MGLQMHGVLHEAGDTFCQLANKPAAFFGIAICVHLAVLSWSSNSNDELLTLLLSISSRKGFILKWVSLLITIPVLTVVALLSSLCT
jgi:hypothetical protein